MKNLLLMSCAVALMVLLISCGGGSSQGSGGSSGGGEEWIVDGADGGGGQGTGGALTAGITLGYEPMQDMPLQFTGAKIYRNRIHGGEFATLTAGILVSGASDSVKIANNFITGGKGAVSLSMGIDVTAAAVDIVGNTIDAGGSQGAATAIYLENKSNVRVDNNILFGKEATRVYGMERIAPMVTISSLKNNLFDRKLDILYSDVWSGDIIEISAVNTLPAARDSHDNIEGTAAFNDALHGNYHLTSQSDALDMGLAVADFITNDIDKEGRPVGAGFDIGADEFVPGVEPDNEGEEDAEDDEDPDESEVMFD